VERHAGRTDDHRFRGSEFIREGNGADDEDSAAGPREKQVGFQAASHAFDLAFDLWRPVKPRWPNAGLEPWATRQDAGLAALGQGWPFAAAHGSRSAVGYTEPGRGAEWWGTAFLVTFGAFAKGDPL